MEQYMFGASLSDNNIVGNRKTSKPGGLSSARLTLWLLLTTWRGCRNRRLST